MRRLVRALAWIVAVSAALWALVAVVVAAVARSHGVGHSLSPGVDPFFLAGVLAPAVVGLGVAVRRPGNRVAWILLLGGLSVAVVMAADVIAGLALHDDRRSLIGRWAALVSQEWLCFFAWPLALVFLFPDGHLPSGLWRAPAIVAVVSVTGMVLLLFLGSRQVSGSFGTAATPLPWVIGERTATVPFWACFAGFVASLVSAVACVRARYRKGSETERRQVLWLAYGALLLPLWFGATALWSLAFGDAGGEGWALLMLVQAWLAVAVAVAVSRWV